MKALEELQVLVHPGFSVAPDNARFTGVTDEEFQPVFQRYFQKAETLPKDGFIFIFGHATEQKYQEHLEAGEVYTQCVEEICRNTENRVQLIHKRSDTFEFDPTFEGAFDYEMVVLEQLETLKFSIGKRTRLVVYGETAGECSRLTAQTFKRKGNFTTDAIVDLDCTELSLTRFSSSIDILLNEAPHLIEGISFTGNVLKNIS